MLLGIGVSIGRMIGFAFANDVKRKKDSKIKNRKEAYGIDSLDIDK